MPDLWSTGGDGLACNIQQPSPSRVGELGPGGCRAADSAYGAVCKLTEHGLLGEHSAVEPSAAGGKYWLPSTSDPSGRGPGEQ